jgi:hypothetical protein
MLLLAGIGWAQQPFNSAKKEMTPAALQTEIEALKPARIAWREIPWKSCLLDGLQESREKQKPVLLWIFIDRPADDGRC